MITDALGPPKAKPRHVGCGRCFVSALYPKLTTTAPAAETAAAPVAPATAPAALAAMSPHLPPYSPPSPPPPSQPTSPPNDPPPHSPPITPSDSICLDMCVSLGVSGTVNRHNDGVCSDGWEGSRSMVCTPEPKQRGASTESGVPLLPRLPP